MDFDSMTTDELETHFPPSEDNRWEFKDANYLTKPKRSALDAELGKQVSAFSNTGGGYLVFGVENKTKKIQPCEQLVERTSMKDFLTTKVSSSTEYPISNFRVHRIPFTNDPAESVYLISIPDSPAAPHQAKIEKRYYWRLDGSSEPAPHFHLELLRNRFTKTTLDVELPITHSHLFKQFRAVNGDVIQSSLTLTINVHVRNTSSHFTASWGLLLRNAGDAVETKWKTKHGLLSKLACERGTPDALLPSQPGWCSLEVTSIVRTRSGIQDHDVECIREWGTFGILLSPVSHNYVGVAIYYGWNNKNDDKFLEIGRSLEQMKSDGRSIGG